MDEELNEAEQAGVDAVDCIMPGMIATNLEPSNARLAEIASEHIEKHWAELDDDGKLAAFVYLAAVMGQHAAQKAKQVMQAFVDGSSEPFSASGWPLRTDGGR